MGRWKRKRGQRFPKEFMFQLTDKEFAFLRSQNATLENGFPFQSLKKTPSGLWKDWKGNE